MTAAPTPPEMKDAVLAVVANDHEWTARSLESILVPEGYRVLRAGTGYEAVRLIRDTSPDLIILDLQMPDIGGPDVCRALQEGPGFDPTVPILVTTAGTAGRATRLEAFQAGAWDFFYQPIDRDTLMAKLKVYLKARLATRNLKRGVLVNDRTGLYNAGGLSRRGAEIASEARRRGEPVACVVLRTTPAAEDEPLTEIEADVVDGQVATVLHQQGRRADAAGHLGPWEFGVVAPRLREGGVQSMVSRFDSTLQQLGPNVRLRAGFCVAEGDEVVPTDVLDMLTRAGHAAREASPAQPVRAL